MLNQVCASRLLDAPLERVHCCPICQQERPFFFIGIQSWPPTHRRRRDLTPDLALWECGQCKASISTELAQERDYSR